MQLQDIRLMNKSPKLLIHYYKTSIYRFCTNQILEPK